MTDFEKENFCSLEASRILKEVGYDEVCYAGHRKISGKTDFFASPIKNSELEGLIIKSYEVCAPTFLSARKWLREHPLKIDINVVWLAGRFDAIVNFYPKPHFAPGYTAPVQHARINGIETEPEAWNMAILEAVKLIKKMANN